MQTAPAAPRGSTVKPLVASLLHDKFRVALTGAVIMLGAIVAALAIRPLYQADSTLLVLLGSEYTYRPVAGENISVTNALDREQILRTEIEILGSADLHREVIRAIGVERLYPELLEPPGALSRAKSEQEQRARYRPDSDVVANTHQQLTGLEAALAAERGDQAPGTYRVGQNPLFLQIEMDSAKAKVDLQGAKARAAQDEVQLVQVGAALSVLNEDEQHLTELERARAVLEEDFRSAAKVRDEHRVTETVQADRQSNMRVLQEAVVPMLPRPTRKLILIAGAILSLMGAAGVGVASHFLRRVYLIPEAVEADTGLSVLCSVPNKMRRAAEDLAVRPS